MTNEHDAFRSETHMPENGMMDAILYDGVDPLAVWRSHMREVTMARQLAERRLATRAPSVRQSAPARLVAAQERAAEFAVEMERINVDHRNWQREHDHDLADLAEQKPRRIREGK